VRVLRALWRAVRSGLYFCFGLFIFGLSFYLYREIVFANELAPVRGQRRFLLQVEEELETLETSAPRLAQLRENRTHRARTLAALDRILPNEPRTDEVVDAIRDMASKHGVEIEDVTIGVGWRDKRLGVLPLTLELSGPCHVVGDFLADMSHTSRVIAILHLDLVRRGESFHGTLVSLTYWRYRDSGSSPDSLPSIARLTPTERVERAKDCLGIGVIPRDSADLCETDRLTGRDYKSAALLPVVSLSRALTKAPTPSAHGVH
jgi:Tfp pilus assembly protein PilO